MESKVPTDPERAAPGTPASPPVRWMSAARNSVYCNVAKAAAVGEGVTLHFGLAQVRERAETGIELLSRVVLSPLAAKNLQQLLNRLIAEHDAFRGGPR